MKRKCWNCQYSVDFEENEKGEPTKGMCRRYPPSPCTMDISDNPDILNSTFPEVNEDDWCGEWRDENNESG
jgi:hypothetical protein